MDNPFISRLRWILMRQSIIAILFAPPPPLICLTARHDDWNKRRPIWHVPSSSTSYYGADLKTNSASSSSSKMTLPLLAQSWARLLLLPETKFVAGKMGDWLGEKSALTMNCIRRRRRRQQMGNSKQAKCLHKQGEEAAAADIIRQNPLNSLTCGIRLQDLAFKRKIQNTIWTLNWGEADI